ncbi:MAG: group III truncated hemoglobin [Alphaproteobacteria bacterium]|nr:group III truncated hemoglobin [Alphaproteobacteria bacterium]
MDQAARRAAITAEIVSRTGIDDAMIKALVHGFYTRVRADEVLGPIFAEHITEWGPHLSRMCAFWSSVTLLTGSYHGRPMPAHMPLPIDGSHFDRWLSIFEKTAHQLCPPQAAEVFIDRAKRIAQSLELGVAMHHGVMLGLGERYSRAEPS